MARRTRGRRITIRIEGDSPTVRLADFLDQLQAIRIALQHTNRVARHDAKDRPTVSYNIIDLKHDSPFAVVLEEQVSADGHGTRPAVAETFVRQMAAIQSPRTKVPPVRDVDALESYRSVAAPLQKQLARVSISAGGQRVALDKNSAAKISRVIGQDLLEQGSVSGRLDRVNFHNTTRFEIFPPVGPRRIVCRVSTASREKIRTAILEFVTVYGRLHFKPWDQHPYAIDIDGPEDIEIHPPENTLPTIMELHGIAPDATGEISSEEFIDSLRYAG